jgi:hypothetical protein
MTGSGDAPLRETEEVSINAIREWPVLLINRKKELQALLTSANTPAGDQSQVTLDRAAPMPNET